MAGMDERHRILNGWPGDIPYEHEVVKRTGINRSCHVCGWRGFDYATEDDADEGLRLHLREHSVGR